MNMEIRNEIMRKIKGSRGKFPQLTIEEWQTLNDPEWCQKNQDVVEAVKQAAAKRLDDVFKEAREG